MPATDAPSPSMQALARRLLAIETTHPSGNGGCPSPGVRVCQKLQAALSRFTGPDGFTALMRRALHLATARFSSLRSIQVNPDGSMDGLESLGTDKTAVEAVIALIAHLLDLLVTFIGEPLTLHLVSDAWPDASLDEPQN